METGFYLKRSIDWEEFEVSKFVPHLFYDTYCGCGANTLALLTGIPPTKIKNANRKNPEDWTDRFMLKFLRKQCFVIHPITKCDVTSNTNMFTPENINDRHVLLFSQLVGKNSASWSVVHNNLWYHNFQTCAFNGLNTINSPTLTCYILYHPSWKIENW